MTKIDWANDRAKRLSAASADVPRVFVPRSRDKLPFPVVYARYVKQQKLAGKKPLPPLQWICYLRTKSRKPETAT